MNVYVLLDPRTGRVRYVGMTEKSVEDRRDSHMWARNLVGASAHADWLRELRDAGLRPDVMRLQSFSGTQAARDAEKRWIKRFLAVGADLTNFVHVRAQSHATTLKRSRSMMAHYARLRRQRRSSS